MNCPEPVDVHPVPGVRLTTAAAAIKAPDRDDVAVLLLDEGSRVSGVFTRSHFKAAPVILCEQALAAQAQTPIRALVVNSGNANAATGERGLEDAQKICAAVRAAADIDGAVLPFSTGVIGERLPVPQINAAIGACVAGASAEQWLAAARAIMTTDTVAKVLSSSVQLAGQPIHITGMTKGSGMIKPDMATMLAYLACDANIAQPLLDRLCRRLADSSFNRITVDGDTSTNDSFVLIATGCAGVPLMQSESDPDYAALEHALCDVASELAQRMVRDAEGATKFVTVTTRGAASAADARSVCFTIAESPLVKTALFAGDANWGRLCMAIGRAPATVDPNRVTLHIGDHCIARAGLVDAQYSEERATAIMAADEITITCDLGLGECAETVWTCDFSYDYVRINAEYRT